MNQNTTRYFVCTRNTGCDDLARRKIYLALPDADAATEGYLRVVDDSGEDYLYPEAYFLPIELPSVVEEALRLAS